MPITHRLCIAVVLVACIKFLLDGVTVHLAGISFDLGHVDAMAYGALLTPVLGAHGWIEGRKPNV